MEVRIKLNLGEEPDTLFSEKKNVGIRYFICVGTCVQVFFISTDYSPLDTDFDKRN